MITVGGVEQARVGAGESVEIGRKPIRPLREDGFKRIDIVDNKRSMSKRHALLIVDKKGVATIRDLDSTNGTYVVGNNGNLMRLESGVDFQLPDTLMRMQFGDVPIDFVRIEEDADSGEHVKDLFSYATDSARKEPDASDLSVDQILDLRAGEPTGIFHAQSVSQPGLSWNHNNGADSAVNAALNSGALLENNNVTLPVVMEQKEEPVEPRNLFDDAQAEISQDKSEHTESVENTYSNQNDNVEDEHMMQAAMFANSAISQSESLYGQNDDNQYAGDNNSEVNTETGSEVNAEVNTETTPEANAQVSDEQVELEAQMSQAYPVSQISPESVEIAEIAETAETAGIVDSEDIDTAYKPAFEPGSVFDKVSKGEFDTHQDLVEAGGFTSEEAKNSADFSEQFEMAKYRELLPFLAENTGLYDDLYAWLAASGNSDVEKALAHNEGYSAYRKAIGQ